MEAKNAKGIVLDLRENPGGYLDVVVDIVSEFIPKNELVLYEEDGNGVRRNHLSKDLGNYSDLPIVILVNEFSASGSEVLTGALQDLDRAVVIGTTTFGKGSVGIQRRLSNEGGIYYTVARWYTPNCVNIGNPHAVMITDIDIDQGSQAICKEFIDRLENLSKKLGLPQRLRDVDIPKEACKKMASDAMKQTRLLINNPRELSEKDALNIYESAW